MTATRVPQTEYDVIVGDTVQQLIEAVNARLLQGNWFVQGNMTCIETVPNIQQPSRRATQYAQAVIRETPL